jgi:hypothetical protein
VRGEKRVVSVHSSVQFSSVQFSSVQFRSWIPFIQTALNNTRQEADSAYFIVDRTTEEYGGGIISPLDKTLKGKMNIDKSAYLIQLATSITCTDITLKRDTNRKHM